MTLCGLRGSISKLPSSLKEILERDWPASEINSAANGFFLQLMFRKWVSVCLDCVKNYVLQIVVPVRFHPLTLKEAHVL